MAPRLLLISGHPDPFAFRLDLWGLRGLFRGLLLLGGHGSAGVLRCRLGRGEVIGCGWSIGRRLSDDRWLSLLLRWLR